MDFGTRGLIIQFASLAAGDNETRWVESLNRSEFELDFSREDFEYSPQHVQQLHKVHATASFPGGKWSVCTKCSFQLLRQYRNRTRNAAFNSVCRGVVPQLPSGLHQGTRKANTFRLMRTIRSFRHPRFTLPDSVSWPRPWWLHQARFLPRSSLAAGRRRGMYYVLSWCSILFPSTTHTRTYTVRIVAITFRPGFWGSRSFFDRSRLLEKKIQYPNQPRLRHMERRDAVIVFWGELHSSTLSTDPPNMVIK